MRIGKAERNTYRYATEKPLTLIIPMSTILNNIKGI